MQKWFIRTDKTKYPDLFIYNILEENSEPEKYPGVKQFSVALGLDSKANARLISAAPDLLEALKELLDAIGNPMEIPPYELVEKCSRVLAKAEEN